MNYTEIEESRVDIQFMSWNESQIQVIHALSMIISYLQRSNVLWCSTLVLLSQMRILLSLSGSYGYDRIWLLGLQYGPSF